MSLSSSWFWALFLKRPRRALPSVSDECTKITCEYWKVFTNSTHTSAWWLYGGTVRRNDTWMFCSKTYSVKMSWCLHDVLDENLHGLNWGKKYCRQRSPQLRGDCQGERRLKAFLRERLRAWAMIHATPMEYAHRGRQSKRQKCALFGNFLHKFTLARTQSRYTAFSLRSP